MSTQPQEQNEPKPEIEVLEKAPPVSAEVRAKILADPNAVKMAETLGMELDDFVNQVGYYLNNPDAEPAFIVATDEKLKEHGVKVPTIEEVEANIKATVAAIKVGKAPSGFDSAKKDKVEISTAAGKALSLPQTEVPESTDPSLGDDIKKLRLPTKG